MRGQGDAMVKRAPEEAAVGSGAPGGPDEGKLQRQHRSLISPAE